MAPSRSIGTPSKVRKPPSIVIADELRESEPALNIGYFGFRDVPAAQSADGVAPALVGQEMIERVRDHAPAPSSPG